MSEKKTHQTHFQVPEMPYDKKGKKSWIKRLITWIRELFLEKPLA